MIRRRRLKRHLLHPGTVRVEEVQAAEEEEQVDLLCHVDRKIPSPMLKDLRLIATVEAATVAPAVARVVLVATAVVPVEVALAAVPAILAEVLVKAGRTCLVEPKDQ